MMAAILSKIDGIIIYWDKSEEYIEINFTNLKKIITFTPRTGKIQERLIGI